MIDIDLIKAFIRKREMLYNIGILISETQLQYSWNGLRLKKAWAETVQYTWIYLILDFRAKETSPGEFIGFPLEDFIE